MRWSKSSDVKYQLRIGTISDDNTLTVPELLFEKKQLIPALQQLLVSYSKI